MTVRPMLSDSIHRNDPWNAMVQCLRKCTRGTVPEPRASRLFGKEADDGQMADAFPHVTVLERLSQVSVSVRWCDVSLCHYGAQTWMLGIAHRAGVCALSAQPIARSDLVYRPRVCRQALALNHGRMLLASAVDIALVALEQR